jgi:HAD superfamily hydrolase (TIGR01484 family)
MYCQIYLFNEKSIPLLAERDGPEREMYYKHTGILAELVDLKAALNQRDFSGCVKAMFLAEPELLAELRLPLEKRFGKSVYIAQTLRTFLEVMDAKVSKGQGLSFAMERLSLKREEVIAFGDEENDIPMFAGAGFSVAPSNAKDTVKAKADLVIGSNVEDGVAVFLEEFFAL